MLLFKLIFIVSSLFGNPLFDLVCAVDNDLNTYDELGKTTAQLIRLRGFKAKDHYVTTTDGYILNVVETLNPLIENGYNQDKNVVLFVHGTITNSKSWLIDSTGAQPIDYSNLNASSLSFTELEELLGDDPTANCLPLLLSNFGHRVFLLNRRGGYESQAHIDPNTQPFSNPIVNIEQALVGGILPRSSDSKQVSHQKRDANPEIYQPISGFISYLLNLPKINLTNVGNIVNPRYWNFSLDEQARYDLPETIDYVLNQTRKDKLSVVSHSAGGSILLMSLINYPNLAEKCE